jgi:S1-C subfamily serine protease
VLGVLHTHTTPFVVRGDTSPYRPRISRETRRLLMTAFLAVLTLWILARIRFPERAVDANPVQPLLTQLAKPPRFSDLASTVDAVSARLAAFLVAVVPVGDDTTDAAALAVDRIPALRIGDDLAIAILDPSLHAAGRDPLGLVALDAASSLALIRVDRATPAALPLLWQPQRLDEPRYVIVSSSSPNGVWLRPVFIGALNAVQTPRWSGPVWPVPSSTGLSAGAVVFTEDAELVGIVAPYGGGVAIVPANEVLTAAKAIAAQPPANAADVGVEVQALTSTLAIASGAETGVVVTWVDPSGSAARDVRPGDVIVAIDGVAIQNVEQWRVRLARLATGATPVIRVTRSGAERDVRLDTQTASGSSSNPRLGISMRPVARVGIEVVYVERGSAAEAAGIRAGDLVTAIGAIDAPTAAQVRSAFASAQPGGILIVAITRGTTHRVMGLQR